MWHAPQFPGRILVSPRDRGPTGSRRSSHRRRSAVFRLERLEERSLLSTTWTVTSGADSGDGTLRQAIADAAPGDTITFAKDVHRITLTSGELDITQNLQNLDIEGPGANKLTISGNDDSRVFDISPATTVTISGLTITDGKADGNAPIIHSLGGGILNQGDLTLKHVVVSNNLAEGATNDTISVNGMLLTGCGGGGGVGNLGTLTAIACQFINNQARGASGSSNIGSNSLPGSASGGGLDNGGMATVTDCQFTSNLAQAGNGCISANSPNGTPGNAAGGAIANLGYGVPASPGFAKLSVSGSNFSNNRAIGGNDNQSSVLPGHAIGGAIASHRLLNFGGSATLDVSDSTFDHNQAIAGNHNVLTPGAPGPARAGPNSAIGGGVFDFGTGTISHSTFDHNQAIGGQGLAGSSGISITVNGGAAEGGGIDVAFPTADVTVSNCTVEHNLAIGGQAGAGGTGGNAGGGGVANSVATARLTITGCIIDHNQAQGGSADTSGPASNGGDGRGGGVYNVSGSTTNVTASFITYNLAIGASGSNGGIDGQGIGGGVFTLGTFSSDSTTVIEKNHASTSNDNIGP